MYRREQIETVHLEVTSHCNARCPQCPRNLEGGARNPNLPLTQLFLDDIRRIFVAGDFPALRSVQVCGNYGDAVMASDFLPIARHIKQLYPQVRITLATNGSLRPTGWWSDLAELVDRCTFGIDGLSDTHALYRRGTDFDTVIENARAYIAAGGFAEWAYLVFKHNEHQVDEAYRLSRELGFGAFTVKATSRFNLGGRKASALPVRDMAGEIEYQLEATGEDALGNRELEQLDSLVLDDPKNYIDYIRNTHIDCKAAKRRKLYISAEGHVFPCCWLGNFYAADTPWQDTQIGRAIIAGGGLEVLDAKVHGIARILDGDFFTKIVPQSWACGSDRLKVCSEMCGEIEMNGAQYVDYVPAPET